MERSRNPRTLELTMRSDLIYNWKRKSLRNVVVTRRWRVEVLEHIRSKIIGKILHEML